MGTTLANQSLNMEHVQGYIGKGTIYNTPAEQSAHWMKETLMDI
jgi:hypothetical protein